MLHITGIVRQNKGRSTLSETLGQVDSVDRGNALVGPDLILRSAQPDFVPQDNYMGEDLRSQLENLYPELVTAVRPRAAKHRPYCVATIQESYARFCEEISGKDYTDQRGQTVSILEENFPKLLNLKLISTGERAKARKVLTSLRAGTFDASLYSYERYRLATFFWVPEVICDSDAIHRNGHSEI